MLKKLLLALCLALFAQPAAAAITYNGGAPYAGGGLASNFTTTAFNATGSNFCDLVVNSGTYAVPTGITVTDSSSNSYSLAAYSNFAGYSGIFVYYYQGSGIGSGYAVTVTFPGSTSFQAYLSCFSGVVTSPLDVTATGGDNTGTASTAPLGPITPSRNGALVITAGQAYNGNVSYGSPYLANQLTASYGGSGNSLATSYVIQTTATSTAATLNTSPAAQLNGVIVSFSGTAAAPSTAAVFSGVMN